MSELEQLRADNAALRAELETERLRLTACGAVALSNTPASAAQARDMLSEYRSASCDDVASAVDREMAYRKRVEELEAASQWRPIETAPKDGRKMLLTYKNRNGKRRTVVGGWVTDEEAAETDTDGVGLEAGWYERIDNWDDYYQVAIHQGEPDHWKPLPSQPKEPSHD